MSTKTVELADPGEKPEVVTVEIRGKRYKFRELEINEYDKLVKAATREEADEDGIMQEVTDSTLLLRLMVPKSCVSPELTPEVVNKMGSRLYRALGRVVNDLHYGDEPIKQIKEDDAETPTESAPGNE